MAPDSVRIAAILGTSRPGNLTSKALALAVDELAQNPQVLVTWLDPAEMDLPFPGRSGEFPDRDRLQAALSAMPTRCCSPPPNTTEASRRR